jgi:peptide/nickel transport system ATP-binding protein
VADEPVSMLDASIRVEILLLFKEIQKRHGVSFLYITHDLATAKYFSDRIVIMYAGKIVEEGPTKWSPGSRRASSTRPPVAGSIPGVRTS